MSKTSKISDINKKFEKSSEALRDFGNALFRISKETHFSPKEIVEKTHLYTKSGYSVKEILKALKIK